MLKTIIYLDQNFVSDMAKAKFMGDTSRARKLGNYAALYDHLKALVDDDKVICPESVFHNYESIEATLAGAVQKVITKLSYGLCFRFSLEIIRFQAYKAAREFLGLPPEETPEWKDGFDDDPHEPVECRAFQHGKGKSIPMIPWQIHPPPDLERYLGDRKAVSGRFEWKDLPTRASEQKSGLISHIYGDRVDKDSVGEARLLREAWQDLGAAEARLADFLRSDHLRNTPFIDILCTLNGAMDCEPRRQPRRGDPMDTLIMATALPYCDIVATSGDMVELLRQTHLSTKYPAALYSPKQDDIEKFAIDLEPL